jgi:hypothetical protein
MFARILLLSIAASVLTACPGLMLSSTKRTPPEECVKAVPPLKKLETGSQDELKLWVADTAPKYGEVKKNYECLEGWARKGTDDEDDE